MELACNKMQKESYGKSYGKFTSRDILFPIIIDHSCQLFWHLIVFFRFLSYMHKKAESLVKEALQAKPGMTYKNKVEIKKEVQGGGVKKIIN